MTPAEAKARYDAVWPALNAAKEAVQGDMLCLPTCKVTAEEIAHVVAQEIWGDTDHTALVKYAETITPAEWLAAVTRIIAIAKERPNA